MTAPPKILLALWNTFCIPAPVAEHVFCDGRKWRFDYAFPKERVAIEVQGGLWTGGRHTRGAALKKEHEKLNHAAMLGWRVLYCEPKELMGVQFAKQVAAALKYK